MKDRPILFSAPLVRAILDGRKTQTRRVVKPQPPSGHSFAGWCTYSTCLADQGKAVWCRGDKSACLAEPHRVRCPYGQPGDRLWVREKWAVQRFEPCLDHERDWQELISPSIRYLADDETRKIQGDRTTGVGVYRGPVEKGRPSIHMPRWASRITLEITGVRVERLQGLSRGDAMAEGCPFPNLAHGEDPRQWFADLWVEISGHESWSANPWVWVVEFKRVTP